MYSLILTGSIFEKISASAIYSGAYPEKVDTNHPPPLLLFFCWKTKTNQHNTWYLNQYILFRCEVCVVNETSEFNSSMSFRLPGGFQNTICRVISVGPFLSVSMNPETVDLNLDFWLMNLSINRVKITHRLGHKKWTSPMSYLSFPVDKIKNALHSLY